MGVAWTAIVAAELAVGAKAGGGGSGGIGQMLFVFYAYSIELNRIVACMITSASSHSHSIARCAWHFGTRCRGTRNERAGEARLENVAKRFGNAGAAQTTAVQDLTLDVPAGEFLVIVGPSGCGKTTVLNLLAGLELPTSGTVVLDGRVIRGPGRSAA